MGQNNRGRLSYSQASGDTGMSERMWRDQMRMVLVLIAVSVALWAFVTGCSTAPPSRDCTITELVVDETIFPRGATADRLISPLPGGPIPRTAFESAGRSFHYPRGIAVHNVYRYKSAGRAAQEFSSRRELEFQEGKYSGPWKEPGELTYKSPIADQFYVACGIDHGDNTCIAIAQYEEYFTLLHADMPPEIMTFQDLERVLRTVDERMAQCLGKPFPTAPVGVATHEPQD